MSHIFLIFNPTVHIPTIVPETPESQIPEADSPSSPVFNSRIKSGKRKIEELSDSEEINTPQKRTCNGTSSQEESQWLSKSVGGKLNGFVYDKT